MPGWETRTRRWQRSKQAYTDRDSNLTYVKVEPAFDDFRSDPRFQKIVQQLALPQ